MYRYKELQASFPWLFKNVDSPLEIILKENDIESWQVKRRQLLEKNGEPRTWADIGIVLEDPYITVIRDLIRFPSGNENGYIRLINRADLRGGQGVVVLPILNNKFQLIYRFRHATRCWHYEAPRGYGEPNVTAEQQAHDEINEEIGGRINKLIDLGDFHNNTGIEGNNVKLFLAYLSSIGEPQIEEGITKIIPFSLLELEKKIADSSITDGFTIAAYTRAKLQGLLD